MENCVVVDIRTKELSQTEEIVNLSHSYKLGQNTVEDGGVDFFENRVRSNIHCDQDVLVRNKQPLIYE